jgi:hypothetical protein
MHNEAISCFTVNLLEIDPLCGTEYEIKLMHSAGRTSQTYALFLVSICERYLDKSQ